MAAAANAAGLAALLVLFAAALGKTAAPSAFRSSLAGVPWFRRWTAVLAVAVPLTELAVVASAPVLGLRLACVAALAVFAMATPFAVREARAGRDCGCFGDFAPVRSGGAAILRNTTLVVAAGAGAWLGDGHLEPATSLAGAALATAVALVMLQPPVREIRQ